MQPDTVVPDAANDRLPHTRVCNTIVCMQVDRLSITMEPKLGAAVRKAARRAKMSVSAWIAEASANRVRNEALGAFLDRWEAEDGAFTPEELAVADAALGFDSRRRAPAPTTAGPVLRGARHVRAPRR